MAEIFAPAMCTPWQLAEYQNTNLKLLDGHLNFDSSVSLNIATMRADVPDEFSGKGPYPT